MCVLGSGSGGNTTVVRHGQDLMLLDAGFGPRTVERRLKSMKLHVHELKAICVTHLDRDHFRPTWLTTMVQWGIRLFVHEWHMDELLQIDGIDLLRDTGLIEPFGGGFYPLPGLQALPVHLAHDRQGTWAFRLQSDAGHIGFATDLGHVPAQLIDHFAGVDLLAIESNYDPDMQLKSTRPLFLKRRIMGRAGHLSNQQAFEAVRKIADKSPSGQPRHVVLLHRSRQCNCPEIVRQVFSQDPRLAQRITLSEQGRRSPWLVAQPAPSQSQLSLFG